MDEISDSMEFDILETCGNAVGFALAAAAKEGNALGTRQGLTSFARGLHQLCEDERFSPHVSLVMGGIVEGLLAYVNLDPNADELL